MSLNTTTSLKTWDDVLLDWLRLLCLWLHSLFLSAFLARSEKVRSFSITSCIITSIAATAYYTMARGEGFSIKSTTGRYIYRVRYIDWALTTPLILLDMANLAGASRSLTAILLVFDELMIILGLALVLSLTMASSGAGSRWGALPSFPSCTLCLLITKSTSALKSAESTTHMLST